MMIAGIGAGGFVAVFKRALHQLFIRALSGSLNSSDKTRIGEVFAISFLNS
jgi:hypothetical protein